MLIQSLSGPVKEMDVEDEDMIEEFIKGTHTMAHFPMPVEKARELYSPIEVSFKLKFLLETFLYILFPREVLTS